MLTLTETAVHIISTLTSQSGLPESAGLRIAPAASEKGGGGPGFALSLAAAPDAGKQVVKTGPARVYLSPGVANRLADQILDAKVTGENRVEFNLAPSDGSPRRTEGRTRG